MSAQNHPTSIGSDLDFLVDSESGFFVMSISDMARTMELDSYYDVPGRMDNASVYLCRRGNAPQLVKLVIDPPYRKTEEFLYQTLRIYLEDESFLAQEALKLSAVE